MPAQINLKWIDNIGFNIIIKDFPKIITDEPIEFHGDNRGPSSVELLLAAIGSCQSVSFAYSIKKYDALIEDITLNLSCEEHHIDHFGRPNKEEGFLRVTKIFVTFKIKPANYSEENLDNIEIAFRAYKKYCVVSESIKKALPIEIKYDII